RCRPQRSSGTRAVSVVLVGIIHHGWQDRELQNQGASCGRLRRVESTEAILLRKRKFSDTSLIVSWCTEAFGCVQTMAKGARRQKSPFAGKLDLFFEAEISIVRSRKSDLHMLTEVEISASKNKSSYPANGLF